MSQSSLMAERLMEAGQDEDWDGQWDLDIQIVVDAESECGCATDDGCSSTCASACISTP